MTFQIRVYWHLLNLVVLLCPSVTVLALFNVDAVFNTTIKPHSSEDVYHCPHKFAQIHTTDTNLILEFDKLMNASYRNLWFNDHFTIDEMNGGNYLLKPRQREEEGFKTYHHFWNNQSERFDGKPRHNTLSRDMKHAVKLTGPYVVFYAFFHDDQYGHTLHDHLPPIAWLRNNLPANYKFALEESKMTSKIVQYLDPELFDRITWVSPNLLYIFVDKVSLFVHRTSRAAMRSPILIDAMRQWVDECTARVLPDLPQNLVVFYSRHSPHGTFHGRVVDLQHEQVLIDMVKAKLVARNRTDTLIVFNGRDLTNINNTMSFQDQIKLFRSATTVIGPHGTGLANIAWMKASNCDKKPQVLEFYTTTLTPQVQNNCQGKSYYLLEGTIPWLDYHHVPYAKKSTSRTTYVSLNDFDMALTAMFGE